LATRRETTEILVESANGRLELRKRAASAEGGLAPDKFGIGRLRKRRTAPAPRPNGLQERRRSRDAVDLFRQARPRGADVQRDSLTGKWTFLQSQVFQQSEAGRQSLSLSRTIGTHAVKVTRDLFSSCYVDLL
jgi:hypothetical protein